MSDMEDQFFEDIWRENLRELNGNVRLDSIIIKSMKDACNKTELAAISEGIKIVYAPNNISVITNIQSGITKIYKDEGMVTEWSNISVSEFYKRQKYLLQTGDILTFTKPEL